MRLLHIARDGKLTLEEFDTLRDEIPSYAVLSQPRADMDVAHYNTKELFHERNIHTLMGSRWAGIRFCAQQTKNGGPNYFWIENCCVNLGKSSEVNEAIDDTFYRLKNAQICYVLLSDVDSGPFEGVWGSAFETSIWFTRCRILLDLIASPSVEFFSRVGLRLGDRRSLLNTFKKVTKMTTPSVTDSLLVNELSSQDCSILLALFKNRRSICKENSVYCRIGCLGCSNLENSGKDLGYALEELQNRMQDKERRRKIYRWLSASDPSIYVRKFCKRRQFGTGQWFLNSNEFKEWKDRTGSSQLWILGPPRSGKSILITTVIENLQQLCHNDASMVMAYFYFDIYDEQKKDVAPMLSALLDQLLQNLATIPEYYTAYLTANQAELENPEESIHMHMALLRQVTSHFAQIYIVLDALDECTIRREALLTVLQQMMVWQPHSMHILVTSRRYPDIEKSMTGYFNLSEIISIKEPLQHYQWLSDDKRLAKWVNDLGLMREILISITYATDEKIHEMESHFTILGNCLTKEELRASIATLVQATDDKYDRILCSIGEEGTRISQRILQWLACSMRPLNFRNLLEIDALNPAPDSNVDKVSKVTSMLTALTELEILTGEEALANDSRKPTYILTHRSIRQYLFSDRIKQGPARQYSLREYECHKVIAEDCMKCLLQLQGLLPRDILETPSLLVYAATFWPTHFQKIIYGDKDLVPLAMKIFSGERSVFLNWIRLHDPDGTFNEPKLERSAESIATPLYYAAQLGLDSITTLLLNQGADINARGGLYGSALQAAAFRGHLHVVKILLNMGANVSAQGGHFENSMQAARVSGNKSIEKLIFEFTKAAVGSNMAPSDSGYASQRQEDSLRPPSIPDQGIHRDLLTEYQLATQAPSFGGCDETYPDDIRSIQSDHESIGSRISTTRSQAELFAVKYLAMFLAQLEDLRPLHETALRKIERARFIPNYRRILKFYYRRLLNEAVSETEKAVTRVLRSRRNRESIAEGIAVHLEFDEENEQPSLEKVLAQPVEKECLEDWLMEEIQARPIEKEYLEDWLRRMQGTDHEKPPRVNQEPLIDHGQLKDSDSDSGFETESENDPEDGFTNIAEAEAFLKQGLAFSNLVLDIRLLMLPHHLRQIVDTTPKNSLQLIENSDTSRINNAKAFLESYTGSRWNWWPLAPRIPDLSVGEQHLQWKLGKRILYTKMTTEQAEHLRGVLDLAGDHPPNCYCCVAKPRIEWLMALRCVFRTISKILENRNQRSTASGRSSSKAAMAYTPATNTSGTSSSAAIPDTQGTNASGMVPNSNSSSGAGITTQAQRHTPTNPAPIASKAPTRVIFGVQGMRRSLEIEQIEIGAQMNDQSFFRELNCRYKKHQWSFQRLLSPYRFEYCNFVKFDKLNVNRVFSFGEGLPDPSGFAHDYDYNPKPPQGKIPLIEPDLFAACLDSCEDGCKWSLLGPWLHDCYQIAPLCEKITCIPKKKSEFPVQCKQVLRDTAWGIKAEYVWSLWMLGIYHLVPLLSSFAFWIYWLTQSPGDWQNACVPTITTVSLFAFMWMPFGFIFQSHRPVRYR